MKTYDVHTVFTPASPTTCSFVERETIKDKLEEAINTRGKQLIVYGCSGSGKTTIIENKLSQLNGAKVTTICMSGLTFDELILNAFDQLVPFYKAEEVKNKKKGISSSIGLSYFGVKAKINYQTDKQTQTTIKRILPPQLTLQSLASFIGEAKRYWILEDLHRVSEKEKKELPEVMKIFADMSRIYRNLKIIAIGNAKNANEVVQFGKVKQRPVVEIHVPLMTDLEIEKIINKGEELLNLSIPDEVKKDIIKYSNGIASVCHQLCLNICFSRGISSTGKKRVDISTSNFESALSKYVDNESNSIKTAFNKALSQKRGEKYDHSRLILETLAHSNADEGLTRDEILSEIQKGKSSYSVKDLKKYLRQLQTEKCGSIIRYDEVYEKYSFYYPFYKVFALAFFSGVGKKKKATSDELSQLSTSLAEKAIQNIVKKIIKIVGQIS